MQAFEGVFVFAASIVADPVFILLDRTSAYAMWGVALIHFVLGLICIDRYRMKKPWAKK